MAKSRVTSDRSSDATMLEAIDPRDPLGLKVAPGFMTWCPLGFDLLSEVILNHVIQGNYPCSVNKQYSFNPRGNSA